MFLMLLLHYHKVLSRMTVTVRGYMQIDVSEQKTLTTIFYIFFLNTEESRAMKEKAEQLIGSKIL
jgi:hypothetical protein